MEKISDEGDAKATAVERIFGSTDRREALAKALVACKKGGVHLIVATDGVKAEVVEALEMAGLLTYFDAVIAKLKAHDDFDTLYPIDGIKNKAGVMEYLSVEKLFSSKNFLDNGVTHAVLVEDPNNLPELIHRR